jgi:alpha-D-ribose 1-methylphosphonate 5-triphosphate synthase subunit PhnG
MSEPTIPERQHWMSVLARAPAAALARCLRDAPALPPHTRLRGPESGLVMVRGRAGGGGAPFNLGEMTVTRCTVQAGGRIGHAYVAGRDAAKTELAARLDAALQDPALRAAMARAVIAPLAQAEADRRTADASRAAATRVEFFTMAAMRS